ncbi:hypothetical protein U1Q18_007517 [Sarracenia purpurea var. burkii]
MLLLQHLLDQRTHVNERGTTTFKSNEARWIIPACDVKPRDFGGILPCFEFLCSFPEANPPQLHSNLKFIQLYRRQAKLISEAAYYFTNLVSAKSFIFDLDAKSLSIDENEFQENMQTARLAIIGEHLQSLPAVDESAASPNFSRRMCNKVTQIEFSPTLDEIMGLAGHTDPGPSLRMQGHETNINGGLCYPFMEAEAGELTIGDVEKLLSLYKDVVKKYTSLCRAVTHISKIESSAPHQKGTHIQLEQPEEQLKKDHMGE